MFPISFLWPQLLLHCWFCKKLLRKTTLQFECTVAVGFYLFGAFKNFRWNILINFYKVIPWSRDSNDSWNKNIEILEMSMSWAKFCFHVHTYFKLCYCFLSVNVSSKGRYETPLQFPYKWIFRKRCMQYLLLTLLHQFWRCLSAFHAFR